MMLKLVVLGLVLGCGLAQNFNGGFINPTVGPYAAPNQGPFLDYNRNQYIGPYTQQQYYGPYAHPIQYGNYGQQQYPWNPVGPILHPFASGQPNQYYNRPLPHPAPAVLPPRPLPQPVAPVVSPQVLPPPPQVLPPPPQPAVRPPPYNYENYPPMPFAFGYAVRDAYHGQDFSHDTKSDGKTRTGSYRTLLPDGRMQIVNYIADENGYRADVQYEGEPRYDQPILPPQGVPHPIPQPILPAPIHPAAVPVGHPHQPVPYQNRPPVGFQKPKPVVP